jgi:hypothetical protein
MRHGLVAGKEGGGEVRRWGDEEVRRFVEMSPHLLIP